MLPFVVAQKLDQGVTNPIVARLGGDEFAVVFWEKEPPRQPREPQKQTMGPPTEPQTPKTMFRRFANKQA